MTKKSLGEIVFKVFISIVVVVVLYLQITAEKKIVYVNSIKLVNQYKGMQSARKEFESKVALWKSNVDSLQIELEQKIKEYESRKNKMSASEKKLMEELLTTKQEQFMTYRQVTDDKIKKEDQELTDKVLSKINDHIKKYGEQKGYTIIMAATQFGNIVYAKEGVDITDEIIEGLNKEY